MGSIMSSIDYLDFELEIDNGKKQEYPVAVLRSPAGEARETLRFPFDKPELQRRLEDFKIALLSSGEKRDPLLSTEQSGVQEFGQALFNALFIGEVRSCYDVSKREAAQKGMGLRLKFRIQPPELAALPWEYLYDSRPAEFVCLSRDTPIVRYLEMSQPIKPLSVKPPLRILAMAVSPYELGILEVEREKQLVDEATKELQTAGLMNLIWLPGQTWRDLQNAMRAGPWHLFHFIGHGNFDRGADEGFIVLNDEEGKPQSLSATMLGRLLADHSPLHLVLLNSCEGAKGSERDIFSSISAILVRRGIPAVLAMQHKITDSAALEFSRAFYEALATGTPVDASVVEARKAVSIAMPNTIEWGTPVLYMRAPDGRVFDIESEGNNKPPHPIAATGLPAKFEKMIKSKRLLLYFFATGLMITLGIMKGLSSLDNTSTDREIPAVNIEGIITDFALNPIDSVQVSVIGKGRFISGSDGKFIGSISDLQPGEKITVVFSHHAYATFEIARLVSSDKEYFEIKLKKVGN